VLSIRGAEAGSNSANWRRFMPQMLLLVGVFDLEFSSI
jgi:hypothetical protein